MTLTSAIIMCMWLCNDNSITRARFAGCFAINFVVNALNYTFFMLYECSLDLLVCVNHVPGDNKPDNY